ncbi:MAG: signal peptide peptidase SppA [Candidatus Aenigmarchaeota archaeon]|nr:signal peptide peptidase SppA [Candidatus Aenigmarchaeota archaeon]NIP40790.1 signal peptide peptidase SppA [Candidatus Aenigmarchaeota archaeon]NIQ17904.1 signal peptide peptidase SppA [Candidatus Aenigmarchaeota archaeon]NIS73493.1 signal peptide peptidase SppA [Candidatus Aenigmarchaeota archaeon]
MKNYGKFLLGLLIGAAVVIFVAGMFSLVSFGSTVAVIRVKGTITSSPSFLFETTTPEEMLSIIEKAEEDPTIRGVLFEINSPGGSAVASREIAYALKRMEKPTVCWMGDIAASGAYWIASSCDHIMADPLTLTGSIGATASYLEFSQLFEKYGITYEQITSGERKDTGTPFRNITEEEREKLQYMIDEIFKYFLDDIKKTRNLSQEQVDQISSGDVFLGKDAIEIGLIDSLGTIHDAKEKAKELAGVEYAEFVELRGRGLGLFDLLGIL